jgi:hypothetical protein
MSYNADAKIPIHLFDGADEGDAVDRTTNQLNDPEGERRVRNAIQNAAQSNTNLLRELMETAEAMGQLQNAEVLLTRAKEALSLQDREVERTELRTGLYRIRYTGRRDSILKRWWYNLTRMRAEFDEKVAQAEKAFHEALALQVQAEQRQLDLRHDVENVKQDHAVVENRANRHRTAHGELDKLYTSIFAGPTPGFPDEDELEDRHDALQTRFKLVKRELEGITRAVKEVDTAGVALDKTVAELERAEEEAQSAFYVSSYASVFLERASRFLSQGIRLTREITENLPKPLNRSVITSHRTMVEQMTLARRTIVAAIESGYPGRDEIGLAIDASKEATIRATDAHSDLSAILKSYEGTATRDVSNRSRHLEDARQALNAIRQSAFEVTVGFGAAAPAYHECCDRAEGTVNEALAQCELITVPPVTEEGLPPPPSYEKVVGRE